MNSLTDEEYHKMSVAALEKAKDSCDCEKYYDKLMKCYKDLIKAKGGKKYDIIESILANKSRN